MIGQAPDDLLIYDFSKQANPSASDEWNRGCPVGFFAQFVGPGEPQAAPYGNPAAWVRCRRVATTDAATIEQESAVTAQEQLDVYRKALEDTARQIGAALPQIGKWLVLG